MGGIVPVAPMNQLSMVRDYIDPGERLVACPNRDVTAPDGSLTIYVLAAPPEGDQRANGLPVPKENFVLYVRAYWPEESALNGSWTPPVVSKVK